MIEDVGVAARVATLKQLTGTLRSTTPPFPRSAKIELDSTCDLSCHFCTRTWRARTPAVMDRRIFRDILRHLRACGVDQLGLFYMNEPFMCDWLPDAIRWAKGDGGMPYVFLTTNGLEATEGRIRAGMEAGLDSLKFALNFADARQMARASEHGGAYAEIRANAAAAPRVRDEVMSCRGIGADCRHLVLTTTRSK